MTIGFLLASTGKTDSFEPRHLREMVRNSGLWFTWTFCLVCCMILMFCIILMAIYKNPRGFYESLKNFFLESNAPRVGVINCKISHTIYVFQRLFEARADNTCLFFLSQIYYITIVPSYQILQKGFLLLLCCKSKSRVFQLTTSCRIFWTDWP